MRSTGSDEPPRRDLADLARRLRGLASPPRQVSLPPPVIGDVQEFDLFDLPANPNEPPKRRTALATLRAASEHAYFYVENGADVGDEDVNAALRAFEDEVWPKVTGAFGLPPIPGVDGDPRIVILHANLGPAVGGYVSEEDAYPRAVVPHSNQREALYLNLSVRPLGSRGYAQVLAHEFQHVVHRQRDPDEDTWVNEGLSEYAAGLVSERPAFQTPFLDRPDTQLNAWSELQGSAAHYGASSLFFRYLLEQTGGEVERLASEPADGVEGVEAFLRDTGSNRNFASLVADWTVANALDEPQGPYGYRGLEVSAPAAIAVDLPGPGEGEVHQFAADYLELKSDDFTSGARFTFEGATETPVVAAEAGADGAFWWSSRGDDIDSTLTRELDLRGVQRATLTFRTWFDIERWFDFGYVEASRDGGRTWTALAGQQTTADDPLGASYGPGYSGRSGGGDSARWVEERIDLSPYAGSKVLLRFELVNDDSTNQAGWAIDDIAVPETGFLDGAEADAGGWERAGFRRLSEPLPQRFELRLITFGPVPSVQPVELEAGNRGQVDLAGLGSEVDRALIVVVGATDGTTEQARYRYEVSGASPAAFGRPGRPSARGGPAFGGEGLSLRGLPGGGG